MWVSSPLLLSSGVVVQVRGGQKAVEEKETREEIILLILERTIERKGMA
jgi:hypothetical protein